MTTKMSSQFLQANSSVIRVRSMIPEGETNAVLANIIAGNNDDGVTWVAGDKVLIVANDVASLPGVYTIQPSGAAIRSTEMNSWDESVSAIVLVSEGTNFHDTLWFSTNNAGGTLDTTAITFEQIPLGTLDSSKQPVRFATTGNVANLGTTPSAGQFFEGLTVALGDRFLMNAQTTASENGIYVANALNTPPTRTADFDTWADVPGATVVVKGGVSSPDTIWLCTAADAGTVGTTAITWTQIAPSTGGVTGSFAAGQLAYATGAAALTGANNIFWDTVNKRLAISNGGYTTPGQTVEIRVANTTNDGLIITSPAFTAGLGLNNQGDGNAILFNSNSGKAIDVYTNGTTIFRFASAGHLELYLNKAFRFYDSDSTNYVGLKSPGTVAADIEFTLPAVDGLADQFLKTNASGALSFDYVGTHKKSIPQNGHGFVAGDLLYLNGTTYTKARADANSTSEVVGIVTASQTANIFTLATGGYITGLSGLTAGAAYFLSSITSGLLTTVEPAAGDISKPVLIADTTTSGYFFNMRGVVVSDTPVSYWVEVTGTSQAAAVNRGYITNNAALVTVTLPATASVGDTAEVGGKSAVGWKLAQNASQVIHFGTSNTTTGTGGSLASTQRYDTVKLVCITANTDWLVTYSIGNLTVT